MRAYNRIAPTLALVMSLLALCVGGAMAAGQIVIRSSSQIAKGAVNAGDLKNNTVGTADVRNGTIDSADVENGGIETPDIEVGAVTPATADFPEGVQVVTDQPGPASPSGGEFSPASSAGAYQKQSAESSLSVTWTGTARAGFTACVFQLRVDGAPAQRGAGEVYVPNGGQTESVSATASFNGLGAGAHFVEVWAEVPGAGSGECVVGPAAAGVAQTFTVEEEVR